MPAVGAMGNLSQEDGVDVEPEARRQHEASVSANGQAPGLEAPQLSAFSVCGACDSLPLRRSFPSSGKPAGLLTRCSRRRATAGEHR
jgi:hypothetical protein